MSEITINTETDRCSGTGVLTGIRPTGILTLGNYIGAIKPTIDALQTPQIFGRPMVFVADLHARTDQEPSIFNRHIRDTAVDLLALGLSPDLCDIYIQSSIRPQIEELTLLLARHVTVAELLRVPALKDKLSENARSESANALLLLYPVMMAADILLIQACQIPVGRDQLAHLELTRKLAQRFNRKYGNIFIVPDVLQEPNDEEGVRILSLDGRGKMSKSKPELALLLTDKDDDIRRKIKRAVTAIEGVMSPALLSLTDIVRGLGDQEVIEEMEILLARHMKQEKVIGTFKQLVVGTAIKFCHNYQEKRQYYVDNPSTVDDILLRGNARATEKADETIGRVRKAVGIR